MQSTKEGMDVLAPALPRDPEALGRGTARAKGHVWRERHACRVRREEGPFVKEAPVPLGRRGPRQCQWARVQPQSHHRRAC